MPKLPALTSQKVITILKKNGFILDRTKGSHQIYRNPGTKRMAVVSFHRKDLPKGTLLEILRQAGIGRGKI